MQPVNVSVICRLPRTNFYKVKEAFSDLVLILKMLLLAPKTYK